MCLTEANITQSYKKKRKKDLSQAFTAVQLGAK